MTVKTILTEPNKLLRQVSEPVDKVGENERKLMDDMLETMYAADGIGLAAPQVGDGRSVIVLDTTPREEDPQPLCLVNPEIVWSSDERRTHQEGCLSLPEH